MTEVQILRAGEVFATIKPNDNSSQTKKVMGDNTVTLSFELDSMIRFNVGDYALIFGDTYYLNTMPVVKKLSTYNYQYDFILQSTQHNLSKAQYLSLDNNNKYTAIEFSVTGTADVFIDLLITNITRVEPGWAKGGVVTGITTTISFSKEDCFSALKKIAQAFDIEYYIEGKRIHLATQETQTPHIFRYGRNKGLYDITRNPIGSIITRLYAFGGTTNIPADYRNYSQRLLLPNVPEEHLISNLTASVFVFAGKKTFFFLWTKPLSADVTGIIINYRIAGTEDWTGISAGLGGQTVRLDNATYEFYFSSITPASNYDTPPLIIDGPIVVPAFSGAINYYLEKNTEKYGIIEAPPLVLDDIYPNRIGKVSSVDATDVYKFKDNTIDFDLNQWLLPGLTAKVTFNSGQLQGYTFDISAFDFGLKEFTILKNKDEKAIDVPSVQIKMNINDEYVLTDIRMPQSYVNDAEFLLYTKAKEYLDKNSEAQFNYVINSDIAYFQKMRIQPNIGDVVTLEDGELEVNKRIRVIGLSRSIVNEYQYTFELGEVVPPNKITQLLTGQSDNSILISRIQDFIRGNRLLNGTQIGDLLFQQGGIVAPNLQQGTGSPILIDANGRFVRGG